MDAEQFKRLQFRPDAKLWSQHVPWIIFDPSASWLSVAAKHEWTPARLAERGLAN